MVDGLRRVDTIEELARVLRQLRRREARERHRPELTYREIAAKTGCSVGVIGDYFSGKVLPPTDRFDALIQLLGAAPAEQGELATARDRVAERRRHPKPAAGPAIAPHQLPAGVRGFAGRYRQLAALDALLTDRGQAVMTVVISGTAGVGKPNPRI